MGHKMTIKRALATFEDFEQEDLYDIILGLAEDQPTLFVDVVDAIEGELTRANLQDMREETCNGYPMYPELHL